MKSVRGMGRVGGGEREAFRGVNLFTLTLKNPWLPPSVEKIVFSTGPDILELTS